tara:strand:+ start:457 stop:828 length:372 start_codon:yes stop_codon:yes gene_type:complete
MNVQNMTSSNGNKVANQFIVIDEDLNEYFQSYNSMIVKKAYYVSDVAEENIYQVFLDKKYWNFSNTTSKYRNKFLNETTKETQAKIKSGEYKLVDLNNNETKFVGCDTSESNMGDNVWTKGIA